MSRSRGVSMMTQLTEFVGPNRAMAPMIVPPDGGWGWVMVFVGVFGACIVDGCTYCFYLFREPMAKELSILEADVSFLASLNTGFYFIGAILACSFGNQWGFRATAALGAIVTSLSYASGYILQDIIYYYITVGVIGGLGSGFISVGAGLPACFYFDKKRSIALGITACGSGLGGMVMPQLVERFMNHFGWRLAFIFQAGILSITLPLGLLIRPLKPVMVVISVESSQITVNRTRDDSIMDFSAFRFPTLTAADALSYNSLRRSAVGEVPHPTQPTIAQILNDETNTINIRVKENSDPTVLTRLQQMTQSRKPTVMQMSASGVWYNNVRITQEPIFKISRPWYKCGCCRSKYFTLPERPLMRTDLYYTGNLRRLPEYTEKDMDLEYHLQVTRVPTYYQIVQDLTKNYTGWCCHNICTGLKYLVDYTMFKSLAFDCLALCGFSMYIAFYLPYIFCQNHLEHEGLGDKASLLVSMIGLGSLMGRGLSGLIITSCPKFDAHSVIFFMTFLSGVSITAMVLYYNIYFKAVCMFIFGFSIGFYVPLRSLIIVDLFGLQKLTSGTGVVIICVGAGSFLGPPLAELIMGYTNDPNSPFYLSGLSLLFASVALLPMKKLRNWEVRRAERKKPRVRRNT